MDEDGYGIWESLYATHGISARISMVIISLAPLVIAESVCSTAE